MRIASGASVGLPAAFASAFRADAVGEPHEAVAAYLAVVRAATSSEGDPWQVPALEASLDALKADHEFLLRGDVFTPDVIDTWIWYKKEKEVDAMRLRPHPYEFCLYYDM